MNAVAGLGVERISNDYQLSNVEKRLDNRAANSMDAKTLDSHKHLERHAKWAKENFSGWSSTTLMGRYEEQGDAIFSRTEGKVIEWPADIALSEKALSKLGEIDRKVLRAYYDFWEPVDVLWRRARMRSKAQFQSVLRRARWRFGVYRDSSALEAIL